MDAARLQSRGSSHCAPVFPSKQGTERTCLSLRPSRRTSSIRVNFGCLLRSVLSLMSRGSNAILWPFSLLS